MGNSYMGRMIDDQCSMFEFLTHAFHQHHHRPRHKHHPVLLVNGLGIFLSSYQEIHMATTVSVGHTINLAIAYLDTNGNPMLTAPVPDAPPAWTNTTPATETLAVAADGNTAVATAVAAGGDVITLTLASGGKSFSATLAVTVQAAPQVLGSIAITPTVN
jgi:hypothetical protein